jgi:hypothetical protein
VARNSNARAGRAASVTELHAQAAIDIIFWAAIVAACCREVNKASKAGSAAADADLDDVKALQREVDRLIEADDASQQLPGDAALVVEAVEDDEDARARAQELLDSLQERKDALAERLATKVSEREVVVKHARLLSVQNRDPPPGVYSNSKEVEFVFGDEDWYLPIFARLIGIHIEERHLDGFLLSRCGWLHGVAV